MRAKDTVVRIDPPAAAADHGAPDGDRHEDGTISTMSVGYDAAIAGTRRTNVTVQRRSILDRIEAAPDESLILVTAPAGYGKSTLMAQVAERIGRSAYLRITDSHDDPAVLIQELAAVLEPIGPISGGSLDRLAGGGLEPGLQAARRLAEAVAVFNEPTLVILDDIHRLRDRRAVDAVAVLIDCLPASLQVIAAGHDVSALRLARMQAMGRLVELGEPDLAFSQEETRALAELLGLELEEADVATLTDESKGWPVAISLALRSLASGTVPGETPLATVIGRSVVDYIRTELLDPLDPERRSWLVRSAVLEVMSGPLCDHALETTGSLGELRELDRSSLLVQAIDHAATEFRYHPLLRNQLCDELEAVSPESARAVAVRAAMWCHDEGASLQALEYAGRSQDRDLLARLMAQEVWPLHWSGRIATLERWLETFDRDGIRDRYPGVAVLAGFIHAIDGRRHESEIWLAAAEAGVDHAEPMPDGSPARAWVALLRGMLAFNGTAAMESDARTAEGSIRADSPFMPGVRLLTAVASMLAGRFEDAARQAREAADLSLARGALPGFAMASGIEASIALRLGQGPVAGRRLESALDRLREAGLYDYVLTSLARAVAARVGVTAGSVGDARHHLAHVLGLRPLMTASTPWLSVPTRLEAIEALIAQREVASARTLMREVDEILRVRPELGTLVTDADSMRIRLERMSEAGSAQWTLTGAELRVLQYLPTHLTFAEIAERLFVSPHTVKSQAVAIYSKLGVSSRRAAIEAAVDEGLLDGSALRFPLGPGAEAGIG